MSNRKKIKKKLPDASIKVCTPYYETIAPETIASVDALIATGLKCVWQKKWGVYIGQARNELVGGSSAKIWQKLPDDYTHYLFLDADIAFKPEDVLKLLRDDKDVISGAYPRRGEPSVAVAGWWWRKDKLRRGICGDFVKMADEGVKKIDYAGGGLLLVKKEVFEKIEYPWFRHQLIRLDEGLDVEAIEAGEDMGFCMLCEDAGIDIWCDCDVKVEHLETVGAAVMDEYTIYKMYVEDRKVKFKQDLSKIPPGQYGNALLSLQMTSANLTDMVRYAVKGGK